MTTPAIEDYPVEQEGWLVEEWRSSSHEESINSGEADGWICEKISPPLDIAPQPTRPRHSQAICTKGQTCGALRCRPHSVRLILIFSLLLGLLLAFGSSPAARWYLGWAAKGIQSSLLWGCTPNDFVHFLAPTISKITFAARKCNSLSFEIVGRGPADEFVTSCTESLADESVSPAAILFKIFPVLLAWSLGKALGKLPKFALASIAPCRTSLPMKILAPFVDLSWAHWEKGAVFFFANEFLLHLCLSIIEVRCCRLLCSVVDFRDPHFLRRSHHRVFPF